MQTLDQPHDIAAWLRASVTGALQCDSRRLQPGDGFVAWPGAATDGRRYVNAALASGAVAALVEREGLAAGSGAFAAGGHAARRSTRSVSLVAMRPKDLPAAIASEPSERNLNRVFPALFQRATVAGLIAVRFVMVET